MELYIELVLFIVWIYAPFSNGQTLTLRCSNGWELIYGKCYLVVPNNFTWDRANQFCQKYGSLLVEPKGYTLTNAISAIATDGGINHYWTGYNRRGLDSSPDYKGQWSDGREAGVEEGVWAPNEPNTDSGQCAYVGGSWDATDTQRRWYMTSCDHVMTTVCERTPCPSDTFSCANGRCVGFPALCNSANDCGDYSDEMDCPSYCARSYTPASGSVSVTSSDYTEYATCLYSIRVEMGRKIYLKFDYFDTEENIDFVEIWDGGPTLTTSTLVTRLSGHSLGAFKSFSSSTNHLIIRFLTDATVQKSGFSFSWSTDFTCEVLEQTGFKFKEPTVGYAKILSGTQTVSSCLTECDRNAKCWGFRWIETAQRSCVMVEVPASLVPDTQGSVYVKTCPGVTRSQLILPDIPTVGSDMVAGVVPQYLYSPRYPLFYIGNYQQAFHITSTANRLITLQILTIDLCCTDHVDIYDGPSPAAGLLLSVERHSKPATLVSSEQDLYIHMDLMYHWNCSGVLMKYSEGCDVVMSDDSGTVTSPGYPVSIYPDIATCTWSIQPTSGRSVKLKFNAFETEKSKDYLKIYQGEDDSGTPLFNGLGFSGTSNPGPIVSPQGLFLHFSTSGVDGLVGFQAEYTTGCPLFEATSVKVHPQAQSYHSPDIVVITCTEGYFFGGGYAGEPNVTMSCQSDGSWNVQNIPFCERGFCGFAPLVANGYIEYGSGVQGGDSVVYRCDPGFSLVGDSNITCLSDGQWSDSPSCEATPCESLSTLVSGATVVSVRGDGLRHGSVVAVSCPQYQEIIGPKTLSCDKGAWKTSVPSCRSKLCPVPLIVNADLNYTGVVNMSMRIHVQCHHGYGLAGGASSGTFQCGVDTPLVCSNVNECTAKTHNCVNATCSDTDGGYTCLHGYIPDGGSPTHCKDVDECLTHNGFCDHNCTNLPGFYQCTCSAGYLLYASANFNGFQLLPIEDGSKAWHTYHINHSCVRRQCNASQVLAISEGQAMTSQKAFYYQDRVEFICNVGFFIDGTNHSVGNVTCGADGQWSKRPLCVDAFCYETHGPNVRPVGQITYGSTYTLECTMPNKAIVRRQRICGYNKKTGSYQTAGDELVCPKTECGPVPQPTGMKAMISQGTTYNSTVAFECEQYYERKGQSTHYLGFPLVVCNADGYWDFGTLHCQGGQCGQPVTPYNGYTKLSSWTHDVSTVYTTEIGAVATFRCNTPGYEPEPVSSTICQKDNNTGQAVWSWKRPVTCVDKQAPVFMSCPTKVQVGLLQTVIFNPPVAFDNTAMKSVYSTPPNFQTGTVVREATYVYFHAEDYSGLTNTCIFPVIFLDTSPPTVICQTPPVITAQKNNSIIDPKTYFKVSGEPAHLLTINANPTEISTNFASIGTNPILSFTATDGSSNTASCRTQMKIEAPKCTIGTLEVGNGNVSCGSTAIGLTCTARCSAGYHFYENPALTEIMIICNTGGDWSRGVPVCTVMCDAFARTTLTFHYSLQGATVDQSCTNTYQTQASNMRTNVSVEFVKHCSDALKSLNIHSPIDAPVVAVLASASLIVNMTFDINDRGLSDSMYQACFDKMLNAFYNRTPSMSALHQLQGGFGCMTLALTAGNTTDKRSFMCSGQETAVMYNNTMHVCMVCPPGTYSFNQNCMPCSAGTYNDQFSVTQCIGCPPEANSRTVGASSVKGCYEDCGLRLYSATGKPPCEECPVNTYWNSSTTCLPCPSGTYTETGGAFAVSQCKKLCPPGSYSHTGLEPCTLCPRNFYQSSPGSKTCTECPTEMITTRESGTSTSDCVDGAPTLCPASRCGNNGQCSVIRHDFYCNCSVGFTGRNCETAISPCISSPCLNGATCTMLNTTAYNCTCSAGYSGTDCETNRIDCTGTALCSNNGTCIDEDNSYTCACSSHSGFYGPSCSSSQDPCMRFPCNNSGVCEPMGSFHRVCNCLPGFSGYDCEINLNECDPSPCMNGAQCQDGNNHAICFCPEGLNGDYCGHRASTDICTPSVCTAAKSCVDNYVADTHYCVCHDGWYFDYGYGVCGSFDKDIYCPLNQCTNGGECTTYDRGYHVLCRCAAGYGGPQCQYDVNECLYEPCRYNGTCTDLVHNYTCACPLAGANGTNCVDSMNGCQNCVVSNTKNCSDYIDGYDCYCKDGFRGNNCQVFIPTCESLPCQHGGTCTNPVAPTEHICTCEAPWTGKNCEVEINNCQTGSCHNGATCKSTSDGFICLCPLGHIGERCEITYDLCDRANPCVGANNTCTQVNQNTVACTCEDAYTGESCESLLWYCTDTTCKNRGQCSVVSGHGVVCSCQDGYSGTYCEKDIDECANQLCPKNSVCMDGVNSATCVCKNGKIGENCDKNVTDNFDIIINPNVGGCKEDAKFISFVSNSTAAFTLVFWVRLTTLNTSGSIVTLYGVPDRSARDTTNWQHKITVTSTQVTFNISNPSFQGSTTLSILDNVLHNGLWHHVTVTWSNQQGFLTLYLDGAYNNQNQFAQSKAISPFGLIYLGSHWSEARKFDGRLSRLQVYYNKLEDPNVVGIYQGSQTVPSRVSISEVAVTTLYTVDYSSQLTNNVCRTTSSCPDRTFNETSFPRVMSCTEDTLVVTPRISYPQWTQATFAGTSPTTRLSTHISGGSHFVWGLYGVGTAEYSSDKMAAAVCTFRLYNKRRGCTLPQFYNGNSPQCTGQLEDGYVCQPACVVNTQVPTEETPKYFTCGKYLMWNDADRVVDFMVPSCGTTSNPKYTVSVTVEYELTSECRTYKASLTSQLQQTLKDLNIAANYGLCIQSNGGGHAECTSTGLVVDCMSDSQAAVQFNFKYLSGQVTYQRIPMSAQRVLKIAMRDGQTFTYLPDAKPYFPALDISTSMTCSIGHQLIGDKCVLCGDGYYYNQTTSKCQGCEVGTYRTVGVFMSPESLCQSCSGSDTTDNTGTPAISYCHAKCYLGQYYNSTMSKCTSCDYGEYSNSIGASACTSCGVDQTTNQDGAIYSNSCIAIVVPTSPGPTSEPGTGASQSDSSLSGGVIAAIVIGVLIAVFIIVGLVILFLTKRLPCMREDIRVEPEPKTPWKRVNRYGELDLKVVNYRLSDIRESKRLDKLPIYPEDRTPDDTISMQYDINVHIPVFTEKLNGIVTQKRTFISSRRASDTASELDRTLERQISQGGISTTSLNSSAQFPMTAPQDHRSMSGRSRSDRLSVPPLTPPSSAKHVRRNHQGRPTADLTPRLPQRTLTPISRHRELPEIQSSEYIRPLPFFKQPDVTPQYYQEFLEPRSARVPPSDRGLAMPTTSQVSSDKILLDSDEEDLR